MERFEYVIKLMNEVKKQSPEKRIEFRNNLEALFQNNAEMLDFLKCLFELV